jgi:hypothetical protein
MVRASLDGLPETHTSGNAGLYACQHEVVGFDDVGTADRREFRRVPVDGRMQKLIDENGLNLVLTQVMLAPASGTPLFLFEGSASGTMRVPID